MPSQNSNKQILIHVFEFMSNSNDSYYNGQMDKNFTSDQMSNIFNQLKTKRNAVEAILKQYTYKPQLSHLENIKVLISCLQNVLEIDSLESFQHFLLNEDNIPIEISLKTLKVEQLGQLIHDWFHTKKQDSSNFDFERVYTVNYRNFLFKKVLAQEKENIDEYFDTISSNKKVKGCDLYQLFIDILSPYFLYECSHDRETFFQKINSFKIFQQIVDEFTNHEKRIIVKDKTKKDDEKYIRRYEFEKLVEFWELINPELELLSELRKNIVESGVQTQKAKGNDRETQTHYEKNVNLNCLEVINRTLRDLNIISERENDPNLLQSIERLHTCLRKEKIVVASLQQNYNTRYKGRRNLSPRLLTPKKRNKSPEFQENRLIKFIYNGIKKESQLSLSELQIFLYEIGLIEIYENDLICNIMNSGLVKNTERVTYEEFVEVLHELMKESTELNLSKLKEYAGSLESQSPKNMNFLSANISGKYKLFQRRGSSRKQRNKKLISKTTYQLDSEDSFV